MNSKPQTKVSKQVSLSVDEDILVDCEHLSMFEKQEQQLLMQYKNAEQEWKQENIVFKQFQHFSFDTHWSKQGCFRPLGGEHGGRMKFIDNTYLFCIVWLMNVLNDDASDQGPFDFSHQFVLQYRHE